MGTSETFGDIKRVIHDVEGIPAEQQLLTDCNDVEMSDDMTLAECNLHGSTTFILKPLKRKCSPPKAEKVHEELASLCTGPHEYPRAKDEYQEEVVDEAWTLMHDDASAGHLTMLTSSSLAAFSPPDATAVLLRTARPLTTSTVLVEQMETEIFRLTRSGRAANLLGKCNRFGMVGIPGMLLCTLFFDTKLNPYSLSLSLSPFLASLHQSLHLELSVFSFLQTDYKW